MKTITGTIDQINEQIKELKTKYTYKIIGEESEIKGDPGKKRRVFTFELELTEKP